MILVGVDVASEKHDVSIMRDTGEVIRDNLTIPNKESGYKSSSARLRRPRSCTLVIRSA